MKSFVIGLFIHLCSPLAFSLDYAGDVFSLEIWKLVIPLDDDGDGVADEVTMPTLRNFEDPAFFHLSKTGDSIIFRVPCGEGRRHGANTACSQLREVIKDSDRAASWGSDDGLIHNMTLTLAIHAAPASIQRVVAAGIYEGDTAILSVVFESGKLLLTRAGLDPLVLAPKYAPGTFIDLMIIINDGHLRALLAAKQIGEWPLEKNGLHFRAGCEVSSIPTTDSAAKEFGEVEIQKLYVTHKSG